MRVSQQQDKRRLFHHELHTHRQPVSATIETPTLQDAKARTEKTSNLRPKCSGGIHSYK